MKNAIKTYVERGVYHIYNRGVDKQPIFFSKRDYLIFVSLLKKYLTEKIENINDSRKNYFKRISLFAFCLVENHYHLLLMQSDIKAMSEFMHSLSISYTLTINRRYDRVGHLYQGIYKARLVKDDEDLINISRYIHNNPSEINKDPLNYYYSSVSNYIGKKKWSFIDTSRVLGMFNGSTSVYKAFLRDESSSD